MPTYRTFQYLEEYIVSSLQYRVYSINLEKAEPRIPGVPLAQWIAHWTSNPKVLGSTPRWDGTLWSVSVVVITSALHAEGRQFEPGTDQHFYICEIYVNLEDVPFHN